MVRALLDTICCADQREDRAIAESRAKHLVVQAESCSNCVADHAQWDPCAYQEAVATHKAGAVTYVEEGAGKLLDGSALLAETVAGGEVDDPDAGEREEDASGDPDEAGDGVRTALGNDEAANHGDEEGEDGADDLGTGGVDVRPGEGDGKDHEGEQGDGGEGVDEEPERLTAEIAGGFALGEFELFCHGMFIRYVSVFGQVLFRECGVGSNKEPIGLLEWEDAA